MPPTICSDHVRAPRNFEKNNVPSYTVVGGIPAIRPADIAAQERIL